MEQELISQFRASLRMLLEVIDRCPDDLWETGEPAFGQVAYHALHYTNLYLAVDEASFNPWPGHITGSHQLDSIRKPYPKTDLYSYGKNISAELELRLTGQDLSGPSGFEWLPISKLELHLYNLRHLQHHIGQLVERLHSVGIRGITWY